MEGTVPQSGTRRVRRGGAFSQMIGRFALLWDNPWFAALAALVVYTAIALRHGGFWQASNYAYFNYLADALLRGQVFLSELPRSTHDLSYFEGRYYLYWPPFPALVLLPLVAVAGTRFSDILFTVLLGGANVALAAVLLRMATSRGVIKLDGQRRGLLILCFALGSVHLTLAPYGRVWFTAQLIGFACVALMYLAAIGLRGRWAFVAAGLALGCALLTRNHLAFAGLWPAVWLLYRNWDRRWARLAGDVVAGLLPVVAAVALLGVYNYLRFGDLFDNGIPYHRMSEFFRRDYERYGTFNLHYIPTNFWYQYVFYPFPLSGESLQGGSLFLLTPMFVGALGGTFLARPRWSGWVLAATVVLVALPILLLMGTGWHQFGPRYTLDFGVPLLLLTALGIRRWPLPLLALCTLVAVVQYLIGTLWLGPVI